MNHARVILVRHGRTVGNVARQLAGHFDTPLTEVGRRQAALLAARWLPEDLPAARVHASDLQRARDTAAHLAAQLGADVTCYPQLRELSFGRYEGLTQPELPPEAARQLERIFTGDPDLRLPGGESMREVATRMADHVRTHAGGTPLVIVSHGLAILSVLCELTGVSFREAMADQRFEHHNTAWTEVELAPDGSARIVALGVRDHLEAGSDEARDPWQEAV